MADSSRTKKAPDYAEANRKERAILWLRALLGLCGLIISPIVACYICIPLLDLIQRFWQVHDFWSYHR